MKKKLLSLILSLCSIAAYAQQKDNLLNWGVKSGFSSTIYKVEEFIVGAHPITNHIAKSEISSFYTAFMRINIHRHYLQSELSYNISNYSIYFPTEQWKTSATETDLSSISTKIIGLEVPLYYGYHIIKEGPYSMSLYLGPKAKYILTDYSRHIFENLPYHQIEESIYPINLSLMTGLEINISRIFFDFSFEYGLHNISKGFTIDNEPHINAKEFTFNRRKNVLSFSIGFMF